MEVKNPFEAPKTRDMKLIYEERKKLSFEDWLNLYNKNKRKNAKLMMVMGIALIFFMAFSFSVGVSTIKGYYFYNIMDKAFLNLAEKQCENINQEFLRIAIYEDRTLGIHCNKEILIFRRKKNENK